MQTDFDAQRVARYGVPVPQGRVARTPAQARHNVEPDNQTVKRRRGKRVAQHDPCRHVFEPYPGQVQIHFLGAQLQPHAMRGT